MHSARRASSHAWVSVTLCSLAAASVASADVRLPSVFGDRMVLQRETDARVWGWAGAGEAVKVKGTWPGAKAAEVRADERGRWLVDLPTGKAGGPFELLVTTESGDGVVFREVMLGDVWLCSGQSNMEWPVAWSGDPEGTAKQANHPNIRLLTIENTISLNEEKNARTTGAGGDGGNGGWQVCSPETVSAFSAVGYNFAREIQDKLGVPVGVISADWGGTVAQAWMSTDALKRFPEFTPVLKQLDIRRDPGQRATIVAAGEDQWWQSLPGLTGSPIGPGWVAAGYDDASWGTMTLPCTWGDGAGAGRMDTGGAALATFDGVVMFRREVEIDPKWARQPAILTLGPIDDMDEVNINGARIGKTHEDGQWNKPRTYTIPINILEPGKNAIGITVLDNAGLGGINGKPEEMRLILGDGKGPAIDLSGEWKYRVGVSTKDLPPKGLSVTVNANTPSVLYNGMISPIAPMAIRGALWYQGESNRYDPQLYKMLMPALIKDWRRAFQNPEMPFYFVQIAPYRYGGDQGETAELREAQAATLETPNTGMVVTMDIGDVGDIHPKNKKEVGRRLALQALAKTYKRNAAEPADAPQVKAFLFGGDRAIVSFERAESAYQGEIANGPILQFTGQVRVRDGHEIQGFQLAGEDKVFHTAKAKLGEDEGIFVTSERVPKPIAVRYGFCNACSGNLVGPTGLPVAPFRSDEWERGDWKIDNDGDMGALRTKEEGFADLFDGASLAGWTNVNCAPSTWIVGKDDAGKPVIHCSGIPTGVLRSEKQYQNFILEMEYRHLVAGGNAGLFVWSDALTARGQPFTRSVEVQVMDGREEDWYTSDGDIFPIHGTTMKPENGRDKDKTRAYPTEKRANPAPLWNHYRVECIDGNISLAVNGKVVTRGRDVSLRKGYICLESEGSPVEFRNIRVKELPATETLKPEQIATLDEGFKPLYNGADLSGWKLAGGTNEQQAWKANDWVLAFNGQGGHLWSEKSYKDFELIVDWRLPTKPTKANFPVTLPSGDDQKDASGQYVMQEVDEAGDSGIYLRGAEKSQVNIWCAPVGSGEVYGYRTDAAMPPEVRAGATPKMRADAPPGQWNRFRITMKGDRLTVVLNGKTVIENAQLPGVASEGPIALQSHGNAVEFANVYIRELK